VYAAAFERGLTPASLMDDYPIGFSIPQNGHMVDWSPENYDRQFRGPVTLRLALEESINVPTVRLMEAVGVDPVISLARRMGIQSEIKREYASALGVSEVSLLELVSAYGVFAHQGLRVPPHAIRRVVAPNGDVLQAAAAEPERVLGEDVAFLVTNILQGAVQQGTAKRARIPGWDVAAKTGTTQDAADLWLLGYTPRLVTGLWVGYDQPRSVGSHETAGRLVAPIWADFMRLALRDARRETVPIPEDIFTATVNWRTGLPTESGDPDAITEYFIRGNLPGSLETAPQAPASGEPSPASEPAAPQRPAVQPIAPIPAGSGEH
jgi:penicillin-binding protein 1A